MAEIIFPPSPTIGQEVVAAGKTFKWNGSVWSIISPASPPPIVSYNDLEDLPDLKSAAFAEVNEFATSSQGSLAESAIQELPDEVEIHWEFDGTKSFVFDPAIAKLKDVFLFGVRAEIGVDYIYDEVNNRVILQTGYTPDNGNILIIKANR